MHDKPGTVGRLMPKIEYFLQPVEGIAQGGRLCVKGPNIMLGYIKPENPGVIMPPSVEKLGENWYDTGDIVNIDESGYITILGREKRFAKIAGEMVSLAAVEELISAVDPENSHAAVCIADDKKGEQIILFTTNNLLSKDKIIKMIKEQKLSELYLPKSIIVTAEIPILATGKLNYPKILEMAKKES
jgi:acyl-[acyl-carrier-protein]-phospholipid O-acyltransferase / long-chain-fatty-acid--[acyl-carrier-protein] ligase